MAEEKPPGLGAKILKTIGVITAVISLVLGGRQIVNMITESAAKKEKAERLNTEAQRLASSGNYNNAWQSISEAAQLRSDYRDEQAEIGMEWLREIRIGSNAVERGFTEIADKILPVLYGAIDTTKKEYAAKVLAHIGWANYLKLKEGSFGVKVEEQYLKALNLDSSNVYAHAMYGHWILHSRNQFDEANRHFGLALKSGQDTKYVRDLMFAAYSLSSAVEYQAQKVRLVNEIRKSGDAMGLAKRRTIVLDAYHAYRAAIVGEVNRLISPKDHHDTFLYLTEGMNASTTAYYEDAWKQLKDAGSENGER